MTDGPFIESKEAIAGVFVLEARDLDHALALAKLTPIVDGGVEVRPLSASRWWELTRPTSGASDVERRSRTRTGASGPTCSPRRCGSRATWTPPRRRSRTPTSRRSTAWARDGVPARPGAWLTTAARRSALNALARGRTLATKLPLLLERGRRDDAR